jgi:hypothetical protein
MLDSIQSMAMPIILPTRSMRFSSVITDGRGRRASPARPRLDAP